jgi:hypothetical protein
MWKIELDGKPHKIELLTSSMSGMKRILKDGYLVFEKQMRFGNFHHSMPIDNHMISIIELDDRYDFRIDNQPFSMLYLSEKTKKNFKQESYTKKYEKSYDYESKPKPSTYAPAQPKKKDNFEFDTGFGMFEYKPSRESVQKSHVQRSNPKPEFVSTPWEMEAESEYKAPPLKKENYDWNEPARFQFEDSTQNQAPAYTQPAPAPQPRIVRPPPPVQQPPPVQEQPLMDLLDSGQSNELSDDLFTDGIGIVPLTNQYKQPEMINFPQQTMQTAQPVQSSIDALDFSAPPPTSYQAPSAQSTAYPTTVPSMISPSMNQPGSMNYARPTTNVPTNPPMQTPPMNSNPSYAQRSVTSPTSFGQPTMQPEEKKGSSTDLGAFFESPAPGT